MVGISAAELNYVRNSKYISNSIRLLYRCRVLHYIPPLPCSVGARGDAVGLGTALQSRKAAGSIPDGVTGIFH